MQQGVLNLKFLIYENLTEKYSQALQQYGACFQPVQEIDPPDPSFCLIA